MTDLSKQPAPLYDAAPSAELLDPALSRAAMQSALVGLVLGFWGFAAAHGEDYEMFLSLPCVHTAMEALGWPSYDELKHWPVVLP